MGCQKSLSLNPASAATEMSLDNAILATSAVAGGEFIWGVRGPYVFKINATTGVLISSAKIDHEMLSPTSIAYDPINDRLLICGWNRMFPGVTDNEAGPWGFDTYSNLYTVNPGTLLIDSTLNLIVNLALPLGQPGTQTGMVNMRWMGGGALAGLWGIFREDDNSFLIRYVNGTAFTRKYSSKACFGNITNDLTWDGIDSIYWANSSPQEVSLESMSSNIGFWPEVDSINIWTGDNSIPFGIEVAPSTGDIYVGTQNGTVKRLSYSGGFSIVSTLNTGSVGVIYKVRYNPYDGLLYCPIMANDTIAVVNPGTNTLVGALHTGYDSPYDLVFSSTKTWVVQQGNLGIKLFT